MRRPSTFLYTRQHGNTRKTSPRLRALQLCTLGPCESMFHRRLRTPGPAAAGPMAVVGPGLTTTALPPSGELALSAASLGVPGRFRPRGDGSLSLNGCVTSLQAPANAHAHTGTLISLATHLRTRAPPFPPHPTPNATATPPHPPHPPHPTPTPTP